MNPAAPVTSIFRKSRPQYPLHFAERPNPAGSLLNITADGNQFERDNKHSPRGYFPAAPSRRASKILPGIEPGFREAAHNSYNTLINIDYLQSPSFLEGGPASSPNRGAAAAPIKPDRSPAAAVPADFGEHRRRQDSALVAIGIGKLFGADGRAGGGRQQTTTPRDS